MSIPRAIIAALACLLVLAGPGTAGAGDAPAPDPNQDLIDLNDKGRFAEAEAAGRERLRQVEASHAADAPEIADVLGELVLSLLRQGKIKDGETLALAERALKIREAGPSPDPKRLAESLRRVAETRVQMDDVRGAVPLYERALAVLTEARGPDDQALGPVLVDLGTTATKLGDYATARSRLNRVIAIYRATLPPGNRRLGTALVNLANVDSLLADYEAARAGYEEALEILRAALGPDHYLVGMALLNLAGVQDSLGEFAAALDTYDQAIATLRKALGGQHATVAHALRNYANTLRETGQHAAARRALEEALAIQRQVLPAGSPQLAPTLVNMSAVDIDERKYEAALGRLEEAVTLQDIASNPDPQALAAALNGLADVQWRLGAIAESRATIARTRALMTGLFPEDHPHVAFLDQVEARLLAGAGEREGALRLAEGTLASRESHLGPVNPDVIETRTFVAALQWSLGKREAALRTAERAAVDLEQSLRETMQILPEARALERAALRPHPDAVLFTGLLEDEERRREWLRACLDWTLASRGRILEEISARHVLARLEGDEVARAALANLNRASNRLAALWSRRGSSDDAREFLRQLEHARTEREDAEQALAEASIRYRRARPQPAPSPARVAAAIPEGSVLIEIVRAQVRPDVAREDAPPTLRFVALALDRSGRMDHADLGDAGTVDRLVESWRAALQQTVDAASARGDAVRLDPAADALARALWPPLLKLAGGARRIFLVPDGSLHQVYFPALQTTGGRFPIESGPSIHLLSTGRDLVEPPGDPAGSGSSLLALGGVPFPPRGSGVSGRGKAPCGPPAEIAWPPLPESRREIETIAGLFKGRGPVLTLSGATATEARLKSEAPQRSVLHLATHGFFLDEECGGSAPSPLLLSGLVLAGSGEVAGAAADDGLLTAEEVAMLDLSGVRLAVLSACNTGLGRDSEGEGIYGLRRALEIAGARSVVMSLWPVPDRMGRRWMKSFYDAWLGGAEVDDAAGRASREGLADLERREAAPHPYLWGGFVTAGDWRASTTTKRP